jgi:hypothetical protein
VKILGKGLSRRGLLKRLAIAVAVGPIVKLSTAVAKAEKRRERHSGAKDDAIWIGHC